MLHLTIQKNIHKESLRVKIMTSVLVLAPHPDDETLGCGGSIRKHINKSENVYVCFITKGEKSHYVHGIKHISFEEVAKIRKTEALKAMEILGVPQTNIIFLDFPDGDAWIYVDDIQMKLEQLITSIKPSTIYCPHIDDGHLDHQTTYMAVKSALENLSDIQVELRYYIIWGILPSFNLKIDLSQDEYSTKEKAISVYQSQISLLGEDFFYSFLKPYEKFYVEILPRKE